MKLYYSSGACSLASHIALREAGDNIQLDKVDMKTKQTSDGQDFFSISPNGYVPAVTTNKGTHLTEGVAILQYIADQYPASNLAPANGTDERYALQTWLNFITTELHKGFSPFFNPKLDKESEFAADVRAKLAKRFAYVDGQLAKTGAFLTGNTLTVADAYLFTVTRWIRNAGLNLADFPALSAFMQRMYERPAVHAALEAEGLPTSFTIPTSH